MIEFDVIITNGYVDGDTIYNKCKDGWKFVITLPAKTIHPHAVETDKATIFSKYIKLSVEECSRQQVIINYDELIEESKSLLFYFFLKNYCKVCQSVVIYP